MTKIKKTGKAISLMLTAVMGFSCLACGKSEYTVSESTVFSDNIPFSLSVMGGGIDQMQAQARILNESVNPYLETSYIARFNEAEASEQTPFTMEVDVYAYELVSLGLTFYEQTDGAFDFTLSPVSQLWHVDARSLEDIGRGCEIPELPAISSLQPDAGKADLVSAWEEDGKYYLTKTGDVTIDLGGIAKGYLADLCADIAQKQAKSALINVGGTLYLYGDKIDGNQAQDWKIGVTHCFDEPYPYLCGLTVEKNTAVVTSGTYERYYEKDGVRVCHLIDPFTSLPVGVGIENGTYVNTENYVVSATVLGASGAECDAIATAVCVLGAEKGAELVASRGLSAVIVTADRKVKTVGNLNLMKTDDYPIGSMQKL